MQTILLLLVLLAAVQGILWATFTAPLNGPDESAHAAYVQSVAETGHGPHTNGGSGTTSTAMAKLVAQLGLGEIRGHLEGRPDAGGVKAVQGEIGALPADAWKDGTGPNAVAQNPPLYYLYAAVAYKLSPDRSLLGRLFAIRLATVGLFVLTVVFAWLLAAEIFAPLWQRLFATALVALQPKLVAMGAVINPDTLLFAVSTGFLWMTSRVIVRGPTFGRVVTTAAFAAAAMLTHGRGLYLVPALCIVMAAAVVKHRPSTSAILRFGVAVVVVLSAAALAAMLWTSPQSGGMAYGGEVAQHTAFNARQFLSYVFQFYFGPFSFLQPLGPPYGYRQVYVETFFGGFGSLEVNYRTSVYDAIQIAAGAGILLLTGTAIARWHAVARHWAAWVSAVGFFGSLLLVLHVSAYRDLSVGGDPLLTGRYLLPAVALYGVAITWVVGSLPRFARLPSAGVLLGLASALALQGLLLEAVRFYA